MRGNTIAIVLHESDDRFASAGYLMHALAQRWEGQGMHVSIVRGIERPIDADLIVPHLDVTVVPPAYRAFLARHPRVINGRVSDISKSVISRQLLARNDAYDGEVIVKTNGNFGGVPDRRVPQPKRSLAARAIGRIGRIFRPSNGWHAISCMKSGEYPVFASLADVPKAVFKNPHLVVEKFLPEKYEGGHCIRYSYVLGDRQIDFRISSDRRVIKGAYALSMEETPTPAELITLHQTLGFDYAKLDYVLRDGKVVLFDVNWTPSYSALARFGLSDRVAEHLAGGLAGFLGNGVAAARA